MVHWRQQAADRREQFWGCGRTLGLLEESTSPETSRGERARERLGSAAWVAAEDLDRHWGRGRIRPVVVGVELKQHGEEAAEEMRHEDEKEEGDAETDGRAAKEEGVEG